MDIAEWLRTLGLGQYAPAFIDNDIGPDVLPRLTADDLKELGVTSIGIAGGCWRPLPHCAPRRRVSPNRVPGNCPRKPSGGSLP